MQKYVLSTGTEHSFVFARGRRALRVRPRRGARLAGTGDKCPAVDFARIQPLARNNTCSCSTSRKAYTHTATIAPMISSEINWKPLLIQNSLAGRFS
jgi:hypothetical protein